MKRYLLDTSLVAAFLHGRKHVIELIDPWVRNQEAATSILVYGEVIEYLKGLLDNYSRYQALLQRLFTLEQITPYPLTTQYWNGMLISAECCGQCIKILVTLIP